MKRIVCFTLLLLFSCAFLFANDIVVIGQVLSAEDGMPQEAANVWFKDTDIGTTTNKDGFFMLRSPKPQKTLMVSVVGFKKRSIKLDYGKDQMVEIYLREDVSLLDEILVMPGENPANELMRRVIAHKDENNPDRVTGIGYKQTTMSTIDLTTARYKGLQRRLLKELQRGNISPYDSTFILPTYALHQIDSVIRYEDSIGTNNLYQHEKAFEILTPEQWNTYLNNYLADANFYKNGIILFDKTFVSPLSAQAHVFYNYLLTDSMEQDGRLLYQVTFYPKNEKLLVFKGKMWIDSQTYALTHIDATMSPQAKINYVNSLNFTHDFKRLGDKYYYTNKTQTAGMKFSATHNSKSHFGAMIKQSQLYDELRLLSDTLHIIKMPSFLDSVPSNFLHNHWDKIDSLNQTRVQKLAYGITDLIINGYAHVWKLDVGPLLNLFNYNQLEGARPMLSLRTGERMWPNFVIGGYGGYGFKDHKWKFGGEIQYRFGKERNSTVALLYDRRTFCYGFDQLNIYQENKVEQYNHLFNWFYTMQSFPFNALRERATIQYRYEQGGIRFTIEARGQETYSNDFIPFIQRGQIIESVASLSLYADLRLSWKEQSLDNFFHRHYLNSNYPVVHFIVEGGYYKAGIEENPFGKFQIVLKHKLPMIYGKLHYALDAAWVVGQVPFTKLYLARGNRNWYNIETNFSLLQQNEFCADRYIGGHFRFETSGWLFNKIPFVKELNMHENVIFNIGYGALDRQAHEQVLSIPTFMKEFSIPYMECGVGLSNILNCLSVDCLWRITYRENNFGPLWGLRGRFNLSF